MPVHDLGACADERGVRVADIAQVIAHKLGPLARVDAVVEHRSHEGDRIGIGGEPVADPQRG